MNSKGFSLLETVIFIVLASLVIPIFYLTTTPVIKDMMTPTSYIKARFVAERKMEELMAYTFGDPPLNVSSPAYTTPCYTDYSGYDCRLSINYLDCNDPSHCVGYGGNSLITLSNPSPAYTTKYKEVDVTVRTPEGKTYRASSVVTPRQ